MELLITGGFNVRAVICGNHAANFSTFTKLLLEFGEDNESLFINFQSQKVYLFYDTVILSKLLEITCLGKNGWYFHNSAFVRLMMML